MVVAEADGSVDRVLSELLVLMPRREGGCSGVVVLCSKLGRGPLRARELLEAEASLASALGAASASVEAVTALSD